MKSSSVNILPSFPTWYPLHVLFIVLYVVVLTFDPVAIGQFLHVVLFIVLYMVVLTFQPLDEILTCGQIESQGQFPFCPFM